MLTAVPVLLLAQTLQRTPPSPAPPMPQGQRIEVHDGDTVIARDGARVRIVRRRDANVRAIYSKPQRWLVLLIDYVDPATGAPDGRVDAHYRLDNLSAEWPLGERWEGSAVVDEYVSIPQGGPPALGLTTSIGLVQLFPFFSNGSVQALFQDPRAAAAMTFQTSSVGSVPPASFDQLEKMYVAQAVEQADRREKGLPAGPPSAGTSPGAMLPPTAKPTTPSSEPAVRVGGSIRAPRKVFDAQPVYPPIAQSARVQGVVILEITIGTDGSVADAKVLRSIPLLDQAALDCVKQWKYEPTMVDQTARPVILTVTVSFSLQEAGSSGLAKAVRPGNQATLVGGLGFSRARMRVSWSWRRFVNCV